MLQTISRLTTYLAVISIAGACLLIDKDVAVHFPFSAFDSFAINYLPTVTSFASGGGHQEAIRISSVLALLFAMGLGLMFAILARNGLTLRAALQKEGQHLSLWAIVLVALVLVLFPFVPLLNPESMASVRLVAEGIRGSRLLLLIYSYSFLVGYFAMWFIFFRSLISVFWRA